MEIDALNSGIEEHVTEVMNIYANSPHSSDVSSCLSYASSAGMFDVALGGETAVVVGSIYELKTGIQQRHEDDVKKLWRAAYKGRRKAMGSRMYLPSDVSSETPQRYKNGLVQVPGPSVRSLADENLPSQPNLDSHNPAASTSRVSDNSAERWTLNKKQQLAFKIISERARTEGKPLRMYLAGPAGTGKSRVVHAVEDFFATREESRRLRLTSFMGIAARNINGSTLHSTLQLHVSGASAKKSDLQERWKGVDFLVIDEVSMIGCQLMTSVHNALVAAKVTPDPFGGMNIIFVGDFAQLPPVGDRRLFMSSRRRRNRSGGTNAGQESSQGRLLWLSVDSVVVLDEYVRQSGAENIQFIDLLKRLRLGRCNSADYALLQSRILDREVIQQDRSWQNAPIIVTTNNTKDALNEESVKRFATGTGQEVAWYHAYDYALGLELSESTLNRLGELNSGLTKGVLGRIPLVLGMPVIVSHNYDVEGGVVNGSHGYVHEIRYTVAVTGKRHLSCCVVEIPDAGASTMPGLPARHFPIMPEKYDINIYNRFTEENFPFKRVQVPIQPAFAITAHRSQGQTMNHVVVDLLDCKGTESPYVMISRATSLKALAILRPFPFKVISKGLSEDLRTEFARLETLQLQTLKNWGYETEVLERQEKENTSKKTDCAYMRAELEVLHDDNDIGTVSCPARNDNAHTDSMRIDTDEVEGHVNDHSSGGGGTRIRPPSPLETERAKKRSKSDNRGG